uniref:Uncharacterized protein n=1 Tax=Anguilla anguilla TaxID=7936 RepID=A0A0E9SZC8_ANGAN
MGTAQKQYILSVILIITVKVVPMVNLFTYLFRLWK